MKREGLESELTVEIFAFIGPSICGKELGSFRIEVSLGGNVGAIFKAGLVPNPRLGHISSLLCFRLLRGRWAKRWTRFVKK